MIVNGTKAIHGLTLHQSVMLEVVGDHPGGTSSELARLYIRRTGVDVP